MFIQSVSRGGGYRGDVNQAFRTGRRLAFDDQIDAYTKALNADRATYDFNQHQVADTARNYDLALGMNDAARKEALNFIRGSNAIADEAQDFEIQSQRRNTVQPYVFDIGTNKGQAEVSEAATANFNAQTKLADAQSTNNRAGITNDNLDKQAQLASVNTANSITQAQQKGLQYGVTEKLFNFHTPQAQEERRAAMYNAILSARRESDPNFSMADLLNEVKANPEFYFRKQQEFDEQEMGRLAQAHSIANQNPPRQAPEPRKQAATQQKLPEWKAVTDPIELSSATEHIGGDYWIVPGTNKVYVKTPENVRGKIVYNVGQVRTMSEEEINALRAKYASGQNRSGIQKPIDGWE